MCLGTRSKSNFSVRGLPSFNTLFDENASNHLAIGAAYATSVVGGAEMSEEELEAAGLNRSDVHVDFMMVRTKWISMVSVRMEHAYHSSAMEIGQFKEKLCLEVCLSVF